MNRRKTDASIVLADLESLEKKDFIPVAISVCLVALSRLPPSDWQNRYKIVNKLVNYLGTGMPPPISVSDSRFAIRILLDLEKRVPSREKRKIARCRFLLAYLFTYGPAGKNLRNRR